MFIYVLPHGSLPLLHTVHLTSLYLTVEFFASLLPRVPISSRKSHLSPPAQLLTIQIFINQLEGALAETHLNSIQKDYSTTRIIIDVSPFTSIFYRMIKTTQRPAGSLRS